ncbi:MAG TPA: glycosyltransferase [Acetobacteraceae bacterium]|jgi:glycosyltransferase involved in cell wall biosynthesis
MSDTIQQLTGAATLPRHTAAWSVEATSRPLPQTLVPAPRIAVLIPCRNEESTIAQVIDEFHAALANAIIYVYDNNSNDRTCLEARAAGAVVRHEPRQGKGHVVRRMFADVEADFFILVDGDATYDASAAPTMLRLLQDHQLDMVTAARVTAEDKAYRRGHRFGNVVLSAIVRSMFGGRVTDVLSGYRAFSRRFVKSFPALAGGFETETEFTVHALELRMPIAEIGAIYRLRPAGSQSKLHTWADGLRILRTILTLVKEAHPLLFFAASGSVLLLAALAIGGPVVLEFLRTGLVPRLPSAVLATGLVLLSSLTLVCGLVLESVEQGRKELKRLAYLAIAATPERDE